jgi:phosphoribosylformimino-5-aminoimidazole carboxamide ribotide isomerase
MVLQVVPAVDVLGDEAVRLEQGDFDRVARRGGDPIELVRRFARAGATLIHLVDLDGARSGAIRPSLVARAVEAAAGVPVQASGGVRSVADAEALVEAGAARVAIGTAAFTSGALAAFTRVLGERLVVAVDVRGGRIATAGWADSGELAAREAAARCREAGVARVLCTAVERDGTLAGPDLGLLRDVVDAFGGPVLAAGGVGSHDDLRSLEAVGVEGVVVGRALLDGRLPLSILAE